MSSCGGYDQYSPRHWAAASAVCAGYDGRRPKQTGLLPATAAVSAVMWLRGIYHRECKHCIVRQLRQRKTEVASNERPAMSTDSVDKGRPENDHWPCSNSFHRICNTDAYKSLIATDISERSKVGVRSIWRMRNKDRVKSNEKCIPIRQIRPVIDALHYSKRYWTS